MKLSHASWVERLTNFLHSVRFRMALWFALVLAVVMLVFSAFVYYRTWQDLRNETAARLTLRLSDYRTVVMHNYRENRGWWRMQGASATFVLEDEEALILSEMDGTVAASWGSLSPSVAKQVSAHVLQQTSGLYANWNNERLFTIYLIREAGDEHGMRYMFNPARITFDNRQVGWLIIGQPFDPEGRLPQLVLTLSLGGTFTLLLALIGGYWLADRALWPVKAITRTAQEISVTDLSRRINLNTRDELGELAGTFDRMLDRLQTAFDRQRQFTADASHELRTPLTIIELETGRALAAKRSVEEYRRALEVIQSENAFMSRLVGELLMLARMDAGQTVLKPEPLDLSDLALEVAERFAPLAVQKNVRLQTGDLPELPIQGDRQHLIQMIGNLIDNAIKYSPGGSGQWVCVETGAAQDANQPTAWMRVSDNGVGISAEHLPHLFDRFYRVDTARSHNPEESRTDDSHEEEIPGSGLGLSIVQWIAQMHGGSVTVTSEPGKGTTFEVRLPLHPNGTQIFSDNE